MPARQACAGGHSRRACAGKDRNFIHGFLFPLTEGVRDLPRLECSAPSHARMVVRPPVHSSDVVATTAGDGGRSSNRHRAPRPAFRVHICSICDRACARVRVLFLCVSGFVFVGEVPPWSRAAHAAQHISTSHLPCVRPTTKGEALRAL